jgi:hypothetical protein
MTRIRLDPAEAQEERQLLAQLEGAVRRTLDPIALREAEFKPTHSGVLVPALVAVGSLLVMVLTVVIAQQRFAVRQEALVFEASRSFSAEAGIIRELRRQTDEELREKETQISQIEQQLDALDSERKDLQMSLREALSRREQELQELLARELADAGRRLREEGVADAIARERLAKLELELRSQYEGQLREYEQEMQEVIEQREQEIAEQREQTRLLLTRAEAERATLVTDAARRERQLTARFEREKSALSLEKSAAEQRLAELQRRAEEGQLRSERVASMYAAVLRLIQDGDFAGARSMLREIESLIPAASRPAVADGSGRTADTLTIDTLWQLVESKSREAARAQLAATASGLLTSVRDTIVEAESLAEQGTIREASQVYSRALAEVLDFASLPVPAAGDRAMSPVEVENSLVRLRELAENQRDERAPVLIAAVQILEQSRERLDELVALRNELESAVREARLAREGSEPADGGSPRLEAGPLLGRVAVGGDELVTIEALLDLMPGAGMRLVIKRPAGTGLRRTIAYATVADTKADALIASVDRVLEEGQKPAEGDLVYIAVER